jgi:arylsulfatase A-like enzyme
MSTEGGFRCPCIARWPGKTPAGTVLNGLMSSQDWFPTLVAAAGNPNIAQELLVGKQLGDKTYKVHLDGYNQLTMLTGRGESARHEMFYFDEAELGAVRIDDYKYVFLDPPTWSILVHYLGNIVVQASKSKTPPSGRRCTLVTNRTESAVNNTVAFRLLNAWEGAPATRAQPSGESS